MVGSGEEGETAEGLASEASEGVETVDEDAELERGDETALWTADKGDVDREMVLGDFATDGCLGVSGVLGPDLRFLRIAAARLYLRGVEAALLNSIRVSKSGPEL